MQQYLELLKELKECVEKDNRTGIPTVGKFLHHIPFDMAKGGLPIVTTKKMAVKGIIGELLAFIRGSTDNKEFTDLKCRVWNDNANNHNVDAEGNITQRNPWLDNPLRKGEDDLGKIYGYQWRNWETTLYKSSDELAEIGMWNGEHKISKEVEVSLGIEILEQMGYKLKGIMYPIENNIEYNASVAATTHVIDCGEDANNFELIHGRIVPEVDTDINLFLNNASQEVTRDGNNIVITLNKARKIEATVRTNVKQYVFRKRTDQLKYTIDQLINNPTNRRLLISAWNPGEFDQMALAPCHAFMHYQCEPILLNERNKLCTDEQVKEALSYTDCNNQSERLDKLGVPKYKLNMMVYVRSNDIGLGAPFNITSYGVFLAIMCRLTGHAPGTMHYITGDTHIYVQHMDGVNEQLDRLPFNNKVTLKIADHLKTLEDFEKATPDDFEILNYECHPKLENKMEMVI